jgi:hypothetical protein
VGYIRRFANLTAVGDGWTDFVDDSGARVAVVLKDSPLEGALEGQLDWRVVQKDREWVYLEAPAARP